MESYKMVEKISSKQDFIKLLKALRDELRYKPDEWENNTFENFLESVEAYTEDIDGYYKNNNIKESELNKWRIFADILYGGKKENNMIIINYEN